MEDSEFGASADRVRTFAHGLPGHFVGTLTTDEFHFSFSFIRFWKNVNSTLLEQHFET